MRLLTIAALVLSLGFHISQASGAPGIGVAATINGAEILERKLQTAVNNHMRQQGSDVGAIRLPEDFQEVRMKVLDVLIGQELLWQAAQAEQLLANDAEVDAAFAKTRSRFDGDIEFEVKLQEGGYTADSFREDLRRRLSAQKWVEAKVAAEVAVDDAAVSRFYAANRAQFTSPEQVRARHILLKLDAAAGDTEREDARARLDEIRQRNEAGEDFADLAQAHSQDSSASRGGDLGYFGPGMMVKPFEQAAFGLSAGEVSDIVETRFGLHLIQLLDRKPAAYYTEAEVAGRIRAYLLRQRYEDGLDAAIERLRQQAEIEIANP